MCNLYRILIQMFMFNSHICWKCWKWKGNTTTAAANKKHQFKLRNRNAEYRFRCTSHDVVCEIWTYDCISKRGKKIDRADATLTSAGVKVFNLMCDNLGILMARMSQINAIVNKNVKISGQKKQNRGEEKSGRHTRKIANTNTQSQRENSFKISAGVSIHSLHNI